MTPAPHTYAQWVAVLERLKARERDEEVLQAMRQGTVEWQDGVAERFSKRLIDAVNHRLDAASDKFQRDLARAHGQESAIVQAVLSLRKELCFLSEAICLPAIPEKEREEYRHLVVEQADRMQKSLEDSARNDRSGKLASIMRNHRVNVF